jgi:predicted AAA+ superfamily ATPase
LFRRKTVAPLREIYYWKDYQQHEVDFVLKEGAKVNELIQVTYALDAAGLKESETAALVKAGRELKCRKMTLITWDYENTLTVEGVTIDIVPVWKWLLAKPGEKS